MWQKYFRLLKLKRRGQTRSAPPVRQRKWPAWRWIPGYSTFRPRIPLSWKGESPLPSSGRRVNTREREYLLIHPTRIVSGYTAQTWGPFAGWLPSTVGLRFHPKESPCAYRTVLSVWFFLFLPCLQIITFLFKMQNIRSAGNRHTSSLQKKEQGKRGQANRIPPYMYMREMRLEPGRRTGNLHQGFGVWNV